MIWRFALRRQRIIRLYLGDPDLEEDLDTVKDRLRSDPHALHHALEEPRRYTVTMCDSRLLSKFFRVCSESREEAKKHYRVHIPCRYLNLPGLPGSSVGPMFIRALCEKLPPPTTPGTSYMNPEWDFLHITCWPNTTMWLPPFLHDLKTSYDPRGHGLLNLVVPSDDYGGGSTAAGSTLDLEPSAIHPNFRDSVKATLQQLHEVFIEDTQILGRINAGDVLYLSAEYWFNRSVPMSTGIPPFDRFPVDPRPISRDLEKQYMDTRSCRDKLGMFQSLLSRFGVAPTLPDGSTTEFRLMVAHKAYLGGSDSHNISSKEEAEEWLERDYERWWVNRKWATGNQGRKFFEDEPHYVMESEPAFGFWLFPIEVVAMLNETANVDKRVFDMRCYAPELGLSVM